MQFGDTVADDVARFVSRHPCHLWKDPLGEIPQTQTQTPPTESAFSVD